MDELISPAISTEIFSRSGIFQALFKNHAKTTSPPQKHHNFTTKNQQKNTVFSKPPIKRPAKTALPATLDHPEFFCKTHRLFVVIWSGRTTAKATAGESERLLPTLRDEAAKDGAPELFATTKTNAEPR
ncbi:MAG: hypothetical protein WDN23_06955 [Edaphobacter sp.]